VVGAGAVASFETGTVGSFWQGLWWALSLMTTVGFIGPPPSSTAGAVLSVVLMLSGFVLLASVSAALASWFVKEDVEPFEASERRADQEIIEELRILSDRIAALEARIADPRLRAEEPPSDIERDDS
jgi:hypothetical protein